MRDVRSYSDYRNRVVDFRRGDVVSPINFMAGETFGITGMVTSVLRSIGCLDVEFPWGSQRVLADEVVRLPSTEVGPLPPCRDTSYSSWDVTKSRIEDRTLDRARRVAGSWTMRVYRLRASVAKHRFSGHGRYESVRRTLIEIPSARIHEVRSAASHVYDLLPRIALYWHAPGRQYRPTRDEIRSGTFLCPRCREEMSQAVFRKRERLFSCVNCFFMITPADLYDPDEVQASKTAHDELSVSLSDRPGWVVAHTDGISAAYYGPFGIDFRDGTWSVVGSDGKVAQEVSGPREAYDVVSELVRMARWNNNDAEDLTRSMLDGPGPVYPGQIQRRLQDTAEERRVEWDDDSLGPHVTRETFFRAAPSPEQESV